MAFPEVGVMAVVQNVSGFLQDMGKMDNAITGLANVADKAGGGIGSVGSKIASVGKAAATVAATGIAAASAAIVGIGVASLKTAIDFESAWAGVVKTTDGLVDEFGNLTEQGAEMQQGFRDLAKEVPIAVEELMEIGEMGGQLGVASDDLLSFSENIAAMGVATNLTTDEAATGFAQLANVMGTTEKYGSEAFSRLGSAIVNLGNNSATTERDILNFAQRIAGAASVAGVTEADMLGIGAAFASVGIEAEAGGTAVQKVLLGMNTAVISGGEQLDIFAATAGMSAEDFGSAWEADAGDAFAQFVNGLGVAGDDAVFILEALGLQDQRLIKSFLSLANAGDVLNDSLDIANQGWDENSALAKEAETRYKTTESQMILLKNTLKDVGITIGMVLLPIFNKLLQAATPLIEVLGKGLSNLFTNILIPAIERVGAAFSKLITQIKGFGITALFSNFEDGSSILAEFFENLGFGKDTAAKIASAIQPIIKTIVKLGNVVRETATNVVEILKKEIPKAIESAKGFITGTLIPAFQQAGQFILKEVVPALMKFIGAVVSFVQQHGPAIRNAILAIGAVLAGASIVSAILGIVAAIGALLNPVTLIIGAVALLAMAWTENWYGIQEIVANVIAFLMPIFQALVEFVANTLVPAFIVFGEYLVTTLTPIVQAFAEFIVAAFTAVRDWVVANWPTIQATVLAVLSAIGTAVQAGLSAVRSFWEENGAAIMATVSAAWSAIKDFVTAAITVIQGVIKAIMQAINGDWSTAWDTIKTALTTAWNLIKDEINTALNYIKNTVFPAALEALKTLWSAAWDFMQAALETAVSAIKERINTGLKAARVIIEFILDGIKDKVTEIWNAIPDLFDAGIQKAKNFITSAVGAFKEAGKAVVDAIKQGIEDAWQGLVDSVKGKLKELGDLLPFSEPKDPTSPLRGLAKSGAAIVGNISAGLQEAMPVLQAQLSAALNPAQVAAPVTTIGGNVTNNTNSITIDVVSNPASQPSEHAIYNDVQAALVAART